MKQIIDLRFPSNEMNEMRNDSSYAGDSDHQRNFRWAEPFNRSQLWWNSSIAEIRLLIQIRKNLWFLFYSRKNERTGKQICFVSFYFIL